MNAVRKIIILAGGYQAVAKACGVTPSALWVWTRKGIPEAHWAVIRAGVAQFSGGDLTPGAIYDANEAVRRGDTPKASAAGAGDGEPGQPVPNSDQTGADQNNQGAAA